MVGRNTLMNGRSLAGRLVASISLILPLPSRCRKVLLGLEVFQLQLLVLLLVELGLGLLTGQEEAAAQREVNERVVRRLGEGLPQERFGLVRPAQVQGGLAAFQQGGCVGGAALQQSVEEADHGLRLAETPTHWGKEHDNPRI